MNADTLTPGSTVRLKLRGHSDAWGLDVPVVGDVPVADPCEHVETVCAGCLSSWLIDYEHATPCGLCGGPDGPVCDCAAQPEPTPAFVVLDATTTGTLDGVRIYRRRRFDRAVRVELDFVPEREGVPAQARIMHEVWDRQLGRYQGHPALVVLDDSTRAAAAALDGPE